MAEEPSDFPSETGLTGATERIEDETKDESERLMTKDVSTVEGSVSKVDSTATTTTTEPELLAKTTEGIEANEASKDGAEPTSATSTTSSGHDDSKGVEGKGVTPPPGRRDSESTYGSSKSATSSRLSEGDTYEIKMVQQPLLGAEAGVEKVTLGRLPIIPAPILELTVRNRAGEIVDTESPYLFCSCFLKLEDGTTSIDTLPDNPDKSALVGGIVRNTYRVNNLEGKPTSYLVFEDLSVRLEGTYRLSFRLSEALPHAPILAVALSDAFKVLPWKVYPGDTSPEVYTALSRHLHEQNVPVYIPPLTTVGSLDQQHEDNLDSDTIPVLDHPSSAEGSPDR